MKILFLILFAHLNVTDPADSLENLLKKAEGVERVKIMNELFRAHINSDPVKALGYTRDALTLAEKIKDDKGTAACYNNIGVAYRNQGALELALGHYVKSLEIYTRLNNGEGVATTKNNIANIYSLKKNFAQALQYFEDSRQGFVALGSTDKIIGSMNNLGNLHTELQLYDKAIDFYNQAWKLSESSGKLFADPLTNIGNLFYRQGNNQRAVEYYLRALEIVRTQGDRFSELGILANLGQLFTKAGQAAEAQRYLDQSMALAGELQSDAYLPQILKSMANNFAKQGKMKDAFEYMQKYDAARERVYGEESSRKIAQMDVALELKEKEDAIQELQLSERNKTLELRNTQFIVTAVVLAIISVVALFNLFAARKKMSS